MLCHHHHFPSVLHTPRLYRYLYQWVRANAPDWRPQDLPVVPLAGFLETGVEVLICAALPCVAGCWSIHPSILPN